MAKWLRRAYTMLMAKKSTRDPDAMTGDQFAAFREQTGMTHAELAKALGVNLRTIVRFEAVANRRRDVPLTHAKHFRCKLRELKIKN